MFRPCLKYSESGTGDPCEIIPLEDYYRYGYRLSFLKLTSRLLILCKKVHDLYAARRLSHCPMCLTIIYKITYTYYPKFHIVEIDLFAVLFLWEVFEAPILLGELTMEGSFFLVSNKIEGNGCMLIIKRVLFPSFSSIIKLLLANEDMFQLTDIISM